MQVSQFLSSQFPVHFFLATLLFLQKLLEGFLKYYQISQILSDKLRDVWAWSELRNCPQPDCKCLDFLGENCGPVQKGPKTTPKFIF